MLLSIVHDQQEEYGTIVDFCRPHLPFEMHFSLSEWLLTNCKRLIKDIFWVNVLVEHRILISFQPWYSFLKSVLNYYARCAHVSCINTLTTTEITIFFQWVVKNSSVMLFGRDEKKLRNIKKNQKFLLHDRCEKIRNWLKSFSIDRSKRSVICTGRY